MSDEPTSAGEFYDSMWEQYAELDAVSPAAFHRRRVLVGLARRYASGARRILDAGCGQGALLRDMERAFPAAELHGADVSERTLRDCRATTRAVELFTLDLVATDFDAQHQHRLRGYDLVVCSEVIEHIDADGTAVSRLAALLAPGGTLLVSVPGGRMSRFDEAIGHRRHYAVRRLRTLLQGQSLDVIDVFAWGFPFQNLYRTAVRVAARTALPASAPASEPSAMGRVLGSGYRAFGAALKPLFYLNLSRWGEQLFAVAKVRV